MDTLERGEEKTLPSLILQSIVAIEMALGSVQIPFDDGRAIFITTK